MRQAAHAYFETQVTTTSQGEVLIMLYDGAIKFLNRAKDLIDAKDYAGKGMLISSAIDVINELASSLNAEKGGELAGNLNQLYFYCSKRLFMANSKMDKGPIDEVINILGGIRSAYAQILDTPEAQAALAQKAQILPTAGRASVGVSSPTVPGAPVQKSRVHSAYATQSAACIAPQGTAHIPPETISEPAARTATPATPVIPEAVAVREETKKTTAPIMPDLDALAPPPSLSGKRLMGNSLYRKFAS